MIGHDDIRPGRKGSEQGERVLRRTGARDRKASLAQNHFADAQLGQVIVDEKNQGHVTSIRRASQRGLARTYTHKRAVKQSAAADCYSGTEPRSQRAASARSRGPV